GLWGIDMIDGEEYAYQKGACEYLIGHAEGRGIKVTIAKDSPLCRTPRMYAYQDVGVSRDLLLRRRKLTELVEKQNVQLQQMTLDYHFNRGRKAEIDDLSNRWR